MDNRADLMSSIKTGMGNYAVFQRYPFFRWPAWVESGNITSPGVLLNKTFNQWVCFSNMNAPHEIRIDPTGMITTSYGAWALEFWVFHGDKIYRSQTSSSNCTIEKKPASSCVTITWKEKSFTLKIAFTGIRTSSEEALCKAELLLSDSTAKVKLLAVVRPYDNTALGSTSSIEFESSNGLMKIDDNAVLKSETEFDFVITGSGSVGDINPDLKENSFFISSPEGTATMALGINAKKKSASMLMRLSLDGLNLTPNALNITFEELTREFEQFAAARLREGIRLSVPDNTFNNWMLSAEASLLSLSEPDFAGSGNNGFNFKETYFFARALNRMGYFAESSEHIEKMRGHVVYKTKKPAFGNVINCCYFVSAVVDSFIHTRDTEYLNKEFSFVIEVGRSMLSYTSQLTSIKSVQENSLPYCVLEKPLCYDFALLAHAFSSLAYFARCMGIFGDEKKFDSESARIQRLIAGDESYWDDEFFFLMMFVNYPFNLPLCREVGSAVLQRAKSYFTDSFVNIKSLGMDVFSSIIMDHNILIETPTEASQIFSAAAKVAGRRYILPEFLEPREKTGIWGAGASKVCSGEIFSFLRSMLFIDSAERLSIFPRPIEEWFEPGKEFSLENAPSRFGNINFRYTATPNEIIFHFDVLPKFVPPEIAITLPFEAKIQKNDDFLFKKSYGTTYVINGWPSLIRFVRV